MVRLLFIFAVALMAQTAFADTNVNGYYRKDGTYVAPHVRSSPNSSKSDNYGRESGSTSSYGYKSPYSRDQDRDGIRNQYDYDDNNNGKSDDNE